MKHFMLPVDEGVGRIRETIEELGLAEETLIWFVSDNGGTWTNGTMSINTRDNKGSFYQGGHQVPGIVWAPGRIEPNQRSFALVMTMDIMPTSLELTGQEAPEGHHFDGIDVGPALFQGESLPERTIIWGRQDIEVGALRKGPWKLVKQDELYHLTEDPRETTDLAQQFPDRVAQMQQERRAIYEEALSSSPYEAIPRDL